MPPTAAAIPKILRTTGFAKNFAKNSNDLIPSAAPRIPKPIPRAPNPSKDPNIPPPLLPPPDSPKSF